MNGLNFTNIEYRLSKFIFGIKFLIDTGPADLIFKQVVYIVNPIDNSRKMAITNRYQTKNLR